jgi:hypothetical protein
VKDHRLLARCAYPPTAATLPRSIRDARVFVQNGLLVRAEFRKALALRSQIRRAGDSIEHVATWSV